MCAGFPRLGVLRRLRPARPVQRSARLSPASEPAARRRDPRPGGSRVHCHSLGGGGARLCPGGLATSTPQAFPVASRDRRYISPGSSRRKLTAGCAAPGPHPPGSSRYGGQGLKAPIPHVLLSATLAGPAPSGSTGHVPALSGLLPPSPAPPGSGCPQLHRPAATRQRRRSLTSTRTTAPHGAGTVLHSLWLLRQLSMINSQCSGATGLCTSGRARVVPHQVRRAPLPGCQRQYSRYLMRRRRRKEVRTSCGSGWRHAWLEQKECAFPASARLAGH
jgi:hypothetical protein